MALTDIVEPVKDFGTLELAPDSGTVLDVTNLGSNSTELVLEVDDSSGDYVYIS